MFARALIVLLVVLNVGVAAWWWLRPEAAARPAPPQPAGVPLLRLASEVPVRTAPAAASPAQAPSTPAPSVADADAPQRCFSSGPLPDGASAGSLRALLQQRGAQASVRSERIARGGAWSVLMPPQADRAAAQALAQRIDAAGFKDYYVIGEGALANGVALGRFGNEPTARRHQAALQAAGFAAQVQPPAGAQARFFVDVRAGAAFDATAVSAQVPAPLRPADCGALR